MCESSVHVRFDENTSLAELATSCPDGSRVLHRLRLDFCCGGRRTLGEAAAQRGLDPRQVLAELAAERALREGLDGWDRRPVPELIDHIVTRYHDRLRQDLPEVLAMARKVEHVHADKPDCPRGLTQHLEDVCAAVELHLMKEEQVLFPMLRAGRLAGAAMPVQVMEHEHLEHAADLARTRELTGDLQPPPGACGTWRALYVRLLDLERELMEHIHLENNVLFPRALSR